MTVTYTDQMTRNTPTEADAFVPRYARAKRARKGVRTWMILAPIGALALIGGGATMIMGGGAETQPMVEPEPIAPMVQPTAAAPAPLESSAATAALTTATPATVVRETVSTPPAVVERREAPVERRAAVKPTVAPRVETAPEPTGPQPYRASPSTAVTPATTMTPPAPSIQTVPLN